MSWGRLCQRVLSRLQLQLLCQLAGLRGQWPDDLSALIPDLQVSRYTRGVLVVECSCRAERLDLDFCQGISRIGTRAQARRTSLLLSMRLLAGHRRRIAVICRSDSLLARR